ncbi:60S acidic ribosomal protein P1-like [Salvia splendens]|nr:60S acidic ribosomal protein P1-like [Salvia splendens]
MSVGELGCTYAALLLHDDGIPITAEKISTMLKAANVPVESYWPALFAKLCQNRNVDDLILNVGAGGAAAVVAVAANAPIAAEEKKEEEDGGSDDDLMFNLFD